MFLIDSHCHLNFLENIDSVINESIKANVKIINNICTDINEFDSILKISDSYENIFCSIGHHPENTNKIKIEDIISKINDKVVAVGECGLDYHFTKDFTKEQKYNFEIQIEVSRKTGLPLIIHSRDADLDMIDILKTEIKNGEFKFLLHCFSSSKYLAYTGLDLGGYISFSGILTFKNAIELREIAKNIPLNRILIETDSPYLAPVPYRGKTNQPAYVKEVANLLAKLLEKDFEEISYNTTKNCFDLFKYKTNLTLN